MYIGGKYQIHCTCCETSRNARQSLPFMAVSKARINKFYIFRQCTYIAYLPLFQKEQLKTQNGAKAGDERYVAPKMFAQPENENCPVIKTLLVKADLQIFKITRNPDSTYDH